MLIDLTKTPSYYINLDSDTEKAANTENVLADSGFSNINRYGGFYDGKPGRGCALSHNALLAELSHKDPPFAVFEDDIEPLRVVQQIDVPDDADAVYLGISKFGLYHGVGQHTVSAERYNGQLYRIYNMLAAHAILYLNSDYVNFLTKSTQAMIDIGTNQDKSRAETMKYFNVYALNVPMFYQGGKHQRNTRFMMSSYKNLVPKERVWKTTKSR